MRKKLLLLAMLTATVFASGAFVGCNNDKESESSSDVIPYEVTLASETLIMTVGDEQTLLAEYDTQEGATLSYESSDTSIVTVDEYGRLTAIKEGTATITARYGDASDTCEVTVSLNGLLPALQLTNVPTTEVVLNKSTELDLSGTVLFNQKTYQDVTFTYEVSNPTVGKVENGVFKPLASGTTEITVNATWRGVTGSTMSKTITIEVQPEFLFVVNEGVSEITLCTETEMQSPFVVTVEYDGVALQTSVEVTAGNEYIAYDSVNKTVTSLGVVGEAEITIFYTLEGEEIEKKIPVHVKQSLYTYETTVMNFSAIHGDAATGTSLREILGADILSAYDAEGNALEVKENKVYGVESSDTGKFTTEITIYSTVRGYKLNIEGYSGVFAKAEDLAVFDMNAVYGYETYEDGTTAENKSFYAEDKTKPIQKWDGYYVLANNIDASDYMHSRVGKDLATRGIQSGGYQDVGFHGTFDGQGYTINGISLRSNGLFGYLVDAELKNIAFANVKLVDKEYATTLAAWIIDSTISNVYVSIRNTEKLYEGSSAFACGINNSILKGCIVETTETFGYAPTEKIKETTDETTGVTTQETIVKYPMAGSFTYSSKELVDGDAEKSSFTDVYVISNEVLGYHNSSKYYLQAENEELTLGEGEIAYTLVGVRRYATFAAMQADTENTYASFSSEYWNLENGAPVWKNLEVKDDDNDDNQDSEEGGTTSPDQTSESITVGDFKPEWL